MARIFLFICINLFVGSAFAQQHFMERLIEEHEGQGTVWVYQSDEIARKVDGLNTHYDDNSTRMPKQQIKMSGFRIQVYAGGNSRASRDEAMKIAKKVKTSFPDMSVYTNFQSPRWICRIGDFRTIEEANFMLRKMKETNEFEEASIVKSIIQITY